MQSIIRKSIIATGILGACLSSFGFQTKHPILMWKATSATDTVYLLGSVHVGAAKMYPLPKEVESAYSGSKALIVEVDITKLDPAKMQTLVMSKGMYTAPDSLWKHIDPATTAKVKAFGDKYGMPPLVLGQMRPWLVATMVGVLPLMKGGMDKDLGIDQYFLNKANKDAKKVISAETAEQQLDILSGAPEADQKAQLAESLKGTQDGTESAAKLEKLWMDGDAANLEAFMKKSMEGDPAFEKKLLEDRNPHMADVAESYLKTSTPAMMVVGAAHLVGNSGVVNILKSRGYKVEQVYATS